MKTKLYRNKGLTGRANMKPCGNGFEVTFTLGGTPVFVGNFIHAKEANLWFGLLNREIRSFSRKYAVGTRFPATWYKHFIGNHLYKSYYTFLDRLFAKHTRTFGRAVSKDLRKFRQIKKAWAPRERTPFLKAA